MPNNLVDYYLECPQCNLIIRCITHFTKSMYVCEYCGGPMKLLREEIALKDDEEN